MIQKLRFMFDIIYQNIITICRKLIWEGTVLLVKLRKLFFNFVIQSKAKEGSDVPVASIKKHLNENYKFTAYKIFLGYRSLMDKALITEEGKIANGFFNFIK